MNDISDPWVLPDATPVLPSTQADLEGSASPMSLAHVERITDITPLGARPGPDADMVVPDSLQATLFDSPDSDAAPRHLYAVLDASRISGLAALLETSGLEYRCLFKGDAEQELQDVAPWLVRLEVGSSLTRQLFARHPSGKVSPLFLWDANPGLLFRASASLTEVWRHLRRFTRVRDETGAWFYFRFWEPEVAALYFPALRSDMGQAQHWLRGPNDCPIEVISCRARLSDAVVVSAGLALPMGRPNTQFSIGPLERDVFRRVALGKFERDLDAHLYDALPAWGREADANKRLVHLRPHIRDAKSAGLGVEQATADYCEAALRMGCSPAQDPVTARILQKDQHPVDAARAVLAHARSLGAV